MPGAGKVGTMTSLPNLDHLTPEQLRALAAQLMLRVGTLDQQVETMGKKINRDQAVIEELPHRIAQLKGLKFSAHSEQLNPQQASWLDDLIDTISRQLKLSFKPCKPLQRRPRKSKSPSAPRCWQSLRVR